MGFKEIFARQNLVREKLNRRDTASSNKGGDRCWNVARLVVRRMWDKAAVILGEFEIVRGT